MLQVLIFCVEFRELPDLWLYLKLRRIYVPFGWQHYARGRKTLRRTFVSWGKMFFFFNRREKKQFFERKQMFFSEFSSARLNVFQPEGYIFLGFHPLTYHKPLHFDGFCFIFPLQYMLLINILILFCYNVCIWLRFSPFFWCTHWNQGSEESSVKLCFDIAIFNKASLV